MEIFKLLNHSSKNYNRLVPFLTKKRGIVSKFHLIHSQENKFNNQNKLLTVSVPETKHPFQFHQLWLRDHCRCSECYNSLTFQRNHDILKLDENAGVANYSLDGDVLKIEWEDGHKSVFSLEWLINNSYVNDSKRRNKAEKHLQVTTWDSRAVNNLNLEEIPYEKLMRCEHSLGEVFRRVLTYGFAKIEQVPPTEKDTKTLLEYICRMSRTVFGTFWETGNHFDHKDTGYLNGYLEAHTDNTYFSEAQGYLVFHVTEFNGSGGESLLVDGFHVAKQLKSIDPVAYDYLSTTNIESEYIEPGEHFSSSGTCLRHNPINLQLEQIRFNMLDRAPVSVIPQSEMDTYYRHLKTMASLVRQKENEYWFRLSPGTVLIIDNWRLLHGRASYQGKRVLRGCYYSRSDFMSKARHYGLIS